MSRKAKTPASEGEKRELDMIRKVFMAEILLTKARLNGLEAGLKSIESTLKMASPNVDKETV